MITKNIEHGTVLRACVWCVCVETTTRLLKEQEESLLKFSSGSEDQELMKKETIAWREKGDPYHVLIKWI